MEDLENLYKTGTRWVLSLALPVFVLICFFSKEIAYVFGKGFAESSNLMIILLIGPLVSAATGSSSLFLTMTGKQFYNLLNSIILFLLNTILMIIMIKQFGIIGAAYAFTLSLVFFRFLLIAEIWYLYKIHPYRVGHLKAILCSLFSLLIIYIIKDFLSLEGGLLSAILLITIFIVCYVFFLFLVGLSPEDRIIVDKIINKVPNKLIKF